MSKASDYSGIKKGIKTKIKTRKGPERTDQEHQS